VLREHIGNAFLADPQPILPGVRVLLADLLEQMGAHGDILPPLEDSDVTR